MPRGLDLSEEPLVSNTASPDPPAFMVKTVGSTMRDLPFNRMPTVIQKAKAAIPEDDVMGLPPRLPAHTPPLLRRFRRNGYLVVKADTGGLFVVARHYFENCAISPFFELH